MKKNFIYALLFSFALFNSQISFAALCGPSNAGLGITNRSEAPALQNICLKKLPSNLVPFLPKTNFAFERDDLKTIVMCKDMNSAGASSGLLMEDWFLDVIDPGCDDFERFHYVSNAAIATTYADADDTSMQQTFLATMDYGENCICVRNFNRSKNRWDVVQRVPDLNLPQVPPEGDNDTFWMSAANQGPHLLISWFNTLKNVIRTLLWDGSSWSQTDFNTPNEVLNVHAALNATGSLGTVLSAQRVPNVKNLRVSSTPEEKQVEFKAQTVTTSSTSSSSTSSGNTARMLRLGQNDWVEALVNTIADFGETPRVRAAPAALFPSVAYQTQPNQHTVSVSGDSGASFRTLGTGIGETFDYAAPGFIAGAQPNVSHLISAERTRNLTNGIGRYYQADFDKYNLMNQTCEPLDPFGFVSGINLGDIALVANSIGHLVSGIIGSGLFSNIASSALGSILFQPSNATGIVNASIPQWFGPSPGLVTTSSPLNSLTRPIENIVNVLLPEVESTVQQVSSFVGPPRKKNPKFHSLLTKIIDGVEQFITFEIISTLDAGNSLSRSAQTTEAIPQKGAPFSPAE